jgi:SAM-dependent methyltransferase
VSDGPPTCPVCGRTGNAAIAQDDPRDFEYDVEPATRYRTMRCGDCGSEFLFPRPATADIVSYYPPHYHAYHEDHGVVASALVNLRARRRAREYGRLLNGRPGRLFDVGTGDCRHFDSLKARCQLDCAGVEINPALAARARAQGYDVATGVLEDFDLTGHAGRYDIVSMYHVIEHVREPRVVAEKAFALLRPGGHVVGQLPAVDSWERQIFGEAWGGYHFPRHLQCFSRPGLADCLRSAGFSSIRVTSAPHLQTALSVQNDLIRRGWRPVKTYGKAPPYSLFLLAVMPFEAIALAAGKSGIINFIARKSER